MNKTTILRKQKSIEILKKYKVPYIEHLPHIETKEHVRIRSKEEIAKRAIACLIIVQYACDLNQVSDVEELEENKQFAIKLLEDFQVLNQLSEKEKHILYSNQITEQQIIDMIWKYEAYWVLIWSLGFVPMLDFPCKICDCNYAIEVVSRHENFTEFLATATLRNIDEILDEADLIFRYDWACVDARIKGMKAPCNLEPSVVLERHRALNWLIDVDGDNDWDTVSTNT